MLRILDQGLETLVLGCSRVPGTHSAPLVDEAFCIINKSSTAHIFNDPSVLLLQLSKKKEKDSQTQRAHQSSPSSKPRHILHARLIQYTHPLLVLYISWIFRTCVGEVHAGIKVFCSAVILQNPSSDFNDLLFIGHHLQKVLNGLLQTSNTYFSRLLEPSIHLSTLACRLRQSAFSRRKQAAKEKTFDSITL
ncbi:hypothetical protein PGT21_023009 [Puccinia graminis f. sp. tritici]|uniref:Uncharacterized protein n=1 Tax=Puccinia graminis f. sp. tritici TaxID=56615 RepID=A0A5B0QFX3_PUCGR|nr:hypothetical protein PGT21_023009 [Puccinia graminis f. sp. tritici]